MISGPETTLWWSIDFDSLIDLGTLIRLQKLHIVPCCAVCVLSCLALLATLIAHLSVTQSNPDC